MINVDFIYYSKTKWIYYNFVKTPSYVAKAMNVSELTSLLFLKILKITSKIFILTKSLVL